MYNTYAIRAGAQQFAAAAAGMRQKSNQVSRNAVNLAEKWQGDASNAFQSVAEFLKTDIDTASSAFEQAAHALQALGGQLDQVNALRQQIDQLTYQMQSLEGSLWGADDQHRASISSEIAQLSYRKSNLEYEADSIERQANAAASAAFDEIAAMVNRLHFLHGTQSAKGNNSSVLDQIGHFFSGLWHNTESAVESAFQEFGAEFKQAEAEVEQFQAKVEQGGWLGGTVGFVEGLGKSVIGTLELVAQMDPMNLIKNAIFHPEATFEKAKAIFNDIAHPVQTADKLWETGKVLWSTVKNSFNRDIIHGNAYTRSEWAGYAVGTILQAVLTDGAGAAAKGASLAEEGVAATAETAGIATAEDTGGGIGGLLAEGGPVKIDYSLDQIKQIGPSFHEEVDQVLERLGSNREEFDRLRNLPLEQPGALTEKEIDLLKAVRNYVQIDNQKIMQKVFHIKDLDKYLNGPYETVGGYVARAQDTVHLETATDVKEELRLDYNSPKHKYPEYFKPEWPNPYLDENGEFKNEPVAIMRFTANNIQKYSIPFNFDDIDGVKEYYPCTGTGFLGGKTIIPEYNIEERIKIPRGAEIWIKTLDGQEHFVAKYINEQWMK